MLSVSYTGTIKYTFLFTRMYIYINVYSPYKHTKHKRYIMYIGYHVYRFLAETPAHPASAFIYPDQPDQLV